MTTTRCPACDAALPEGAPWCTLCFTNLRAPVPAPAVLPVPVAPAEPAPAATGPEPVELLADAPAPVLTETISREETLTWPCVACDNLVSLDLPTCPTCGSSFLGGEHSKPSLVLPVVGDVADLSPVGRYALMGTGAIALSGLLFLILLFLGVVF